LTDNDHKQLSIKVSKHITHLKLIYAVQMQVKNNNPNFCPNSKYYLLNPKEGNGGSWIRYDGIYSTPFVNNRIHTVNSMYRNLHKNTPFLIF